jgi:1,4-dihydroxy-2-naphthoate octaprenyltransferase
MGAHDFAIFYPRVANDLRQIELDAMPGRVPTPRGPRPAQQVLPEVAFAAMLFAAITVWLAIGLIRWDWVVWLWIPTRVTELLAVRGIRKTVRCADTLVSYWQAGRR